MNCVITGNGGVATAIAKKFVQEGWNVYFLALTDKGQPGTKFVRCDITKQVEFPVTPDVLIHTAIGKVLVKPFKDLSLEEFKAAFEVDIFGAFNVFKQAVKIMKKGAIIGLTSQYLFSHHTNLVPYLSAKGALKYLLKKIYLEYPNLIIMEVPLPFVPTGINKDVAKQMVEFKKTHETVMAEDEAAELIYGLCTTK